MPGSAVVLDLDGTLSNSFDVVLRCSNDVLKARYGQLPGYVSLDETALREGMRYPTPKRMGVHAAGCTAAVADEHKPVVNQRVEEEMAQLFNKRVVEVSGDIPFFPGMKEVLTNLSAAGHRIGVLSNACGMYVRRVLQGNGAAEFCAVALGVDDVPAPKPNHRGVHQALAGLGVEPCDAVYVGDAVCDAEAANRAKVRSVGVSWGTATAEMLRPHCAGGVADTPDELLQLLHDLLQTSPGR
eukprot:NODE_3332_length_910_cov_42.549170_g3310_i0.p1 GENE.NODE_3332_length_910_cov_42.549170_g3310_i0~~NODE_3332_length_910_cov_42.549170_g3310_i0.p1  ORF type:complete len:241 (+),score=30.29 NODE_3332_length_910_cov_42.549170_g3310_i0:66-788(+)